MPHMIRRVNRAMTMSFVAIFGTAVAGGQNLDDSMRNVTGYLNDADDITETNWEGKEQAEKDVKIDATIGIRG